MDVAYDHIQQESHSDNEQPPKLSTTTPAASSSSSSAPANATQEAPITLEHEFQQAFRAVSSSPWGAKLGGFFGQVKKQSESLYVDAQKEYATAAEQASRGFTGLLNHTRNISLPPLPPLPELAPPGAEMAGTNAVSFSDPNFVLPEQEGGKKDAVSESSTTAGVTEEDRKRSEKEGETSTEHTARPDSLPADIVKEASSLVTRFRTEAPSFISRIQKAEDAADEALLKFGSGLRNFLREAVTVTAPSGNSSGVHKNGGDGGESTELLFETNDAEGKRVFHSSRFDAQLHVIHTTSASFVQDPESAEYAAFAAEFDVDSKIEDIARDLEEYEELRRAMEKLTPEKVEYRTFWSRYYFLRKVIGEEERRRKEVLRGEFLVVLKDQCPFLGWRTWILVAGTNGSLYRRSSRARRRTKLGLRRRGRGRGRDRPYLPSHDTPRRSPLNQHIDHNPHLPHKTQTNPNSNTTTITNYTQTRHQQRPPQTIIPSPLGRRYQEYSRQRREL